MLFTQQRVILVHIAKSGRASQTFSPLLGRLASLLSGAPKKKDLLEKASKLDPNTLKELDPDNFSIEYDGVVGLKIQQSDPEHSKISLILKDTKMEFLASSTATRGVKDLLVSVLGSKVEFADHL